MPNRILRDWTDSERIDQISFQAEVFFTRLIMKVDDYGCFHADTRLLKANLFPLKLDSIREADITRWTAECQKAGLIVIYESNQKKYLQIQSFRQRLDKAKAKFPLPTSTESVDIVTDFPAETEAEAGNRNEKETIPAFAGDRKSDFDEHSGIYEQLSKDKESIFQFIKAKKPKIIEPYVDFWNLFAREKGLSEVTKISDSRRRKFSVRIRESDFNFIAIIRKASKSEFLLTGKWFGFDWIIANDKNYLKVIEGNYDKKEQVVIEPKKQAVV